LTGVPAALVGTNGAGETRTWVGPEPPYDAPVKAEFVSVANGQVELSRVENVDQKYRDPHGRTVHKKEKVVRKIYVPLAKLSASNRRWIEEKNPCETSLGERSKVGSVGTLALRSGVYRVTRTTNDNTAFIECVQNGKVAWSFELHSKLVQSMNKSEYAAISPSDLIPKFKSLPLSVREQYGVDFKVSKSRAKKGVAMVEDNR
jgi:hypothetical protein